MPSRKPSSTPLLSILFDFSIHAFTTKFLQYPFCLEFRGVADFPGLPLREGSTQSDRRCPIHGTKSISHRGVAYEVFSDSSPFGKWTLEGEKKYQWNPFSWKTFKHSLICLPAELKRGERSIAKCELKYLPPLWHFPFGLRLCCAKWAYRRHGKLASWQFCFSLNLFRA